MSDSLQPHGLRHHRLPCPSPSPGACSNSCAASQWCHPTILSSVTPFYSYPQFSPASGSFPTSRIFTSVGQSIEASLSASVSPVNIQDWLSLGLTALTFLQSKRLASVFSTTTIQKYQFFSAQSSLWSNSHSYMTTGKTIALTIQVPLLDSNNFQCVISTLINLPRSPFDTLYWFWCLYSWPFRAFCGPVLLYLENRSPSSTPCWYLKSWLLSTALHWVWNFSNKCSAGRTEAVFAFELS